MTIQDDKAPVVTLAGANGQTQVLTEEGVRLIRAFLKLTDQKDRTKLVDFAERLVR